MNSKRIRTLALATAVMAGAGIGFSGYAEAHPYRHVGWHGGWHRDWHNSSVHWRRHYGFARPVTFGYARPAAVYGYAAPAAYGAAASSCDCFGPGNYGYGGYADGGLFGMGFDGGGLFGLGLGPL